MISKLDWDSDFFKLEVGEVDFNISEKLEMEVILVEARKQKIDLIYLRSPIELNLKVKDLDIQLVDKKITYTADISKIITEGTSAKITISPKKEKPDKDLIELSILAGNYSRFKLDNKIDNDKFVKLYSLWITNSINRKFADEVFIYQESNKVFGMITVKIKNDFAEISLVSVKENKQGKGIGRLLIEAVINWLKLRTEVSQLNVTTQLDNINACRFYEKIGFVKLKKEIIYHLRT